MNILFFVILAMGRGYFEGFCQSEKRTTQCWTRNGTVFLKDNDEIVSVEALNELLNYFPEVLTFSSNRT